MCCQNSQIPNTSLPFGWDYFTQFILGGRPTHPPNMLGTRLNGIWWHYRVTRPHLRQSLCPLIAVTNIVEFLPLGTTSEMVNGGLKNPNGSNRVLRPSDALSLNIVRVNCLVSQNQKTSIERCVVLNMFSRNSAMEKGKEKLCHRNHKKCMENTAGSH